MLTRRNLFKSLALLFPTSLNIKGFAQILVSNSKPGNFKIAHGLGRLPYSADVRMTSPGVIWWQKPIDMDSTYLYLVASDSNVTAKIQVS